MFFHTTSGSTIFLLISPESEKKLSSQQEDRVQTCMSLEKKLGWTEVAVFSENVSRLEEFFLKIFSFQLKKKIEPTDNQGK
jgi:hypothetical protein